MAPPRPDSCPAPLGGAFCAPHPRAPGMNTGNELVRELRQRVEILPFMAQWLRQSFAEGVSVSALSLPRGNGKSLAGRTGFGLGDD